MSFIPATFAVTNLNDNNLGSVPTNQLCDSRAEAQQEAEEQ
jgi:hypothetical protein